MQNIYNRFLDMARIASEFIKSHTFWHKAIMPPQGKKVRVKARTGEQANKIARRRRKNELAKMSRRINWQVAKGISIRG